MGLLRLLLAVSVLSAHAGPIFGSYLIGGKMAVQAFFMISGFYMALVLSQKYEKKKNFYRLFISNRILRIYPTYLIVLIMSIFVYGILFSHESTGKFMFYKVYALSFDFPLLIYLFLSNIFILGMDLVMFLGVNLKTGASYLTPDYLSTNPILHDFMLIPQAWTLSLEFLFYLLVPFIYKKSLKFVILLTLISIILRIYIYSIGLHHEPWTNRFLPTELAFFLIGILSYRFYNQVKKLKLNIKPFSLTLLVVLAFITIFYGYLPDYSQGKFNIIQNGYYMLIFISMPFIFEQTKNSIFDKTLGALSFPIYISHFLIASIVIYMNIGNDKFFSLITLTITVVFSIILMIFIENPIDKYRLTRLKKTE